MQHRNDRGFRDASGSGAEAAPQGQATSPAQRQVLRERARQIRLVRELRQEWFDRNIFGEPAWEILLVLYIIDGEQRRLSTRQVARLANLSLTTTLRWLDYLQEQDLVTRQPNPFDHRVVYTELSDKGRAAMDAYLVRSCGADVLGPEAKSEP